MDRLLRHCLALTLGIVALVLVLAAAGVPGTSILGLAPLALCLAMHVLMGHHAPGDRTSGHHDGGVRGTGPIR